TDAASHPPHPRLTRLADARTHADPIVGYFSLQAEDGIRDATVTGVQTCALPIYVGLDRAQHARVVDAVVLEEALVLERHEGLARSEERRVGKEGRSRWVSAAVISKSEE